MANPAETVDAAGGQHGEKHEYLVVARRYRPQSFEQLVGQEHVGRALAGAITSHRVGHAYLFCGARGVGKTSTARILAKALCCVTGPTTTPCNECDICQGISAGNDVDVVEIDGASNRGIDEMRELRANVNFRPSRARFKIYIIDEVHMLTKEAFNALLKTLEEPPEHVKFIFCTTEPEKVPITILSRCQRFDFAGIETDAIIERLRQIATTEGVSIEQEALEILARRAAGSMRDSQSLLEQLLSFGAERLTAADVHALLGTAGAERLGTLLEFLAARDAQGALAELDQAVAQGVDVGQLLDQSLGYLRDMLMLSVGGRPQQLLYTWGEEVPRCQRLASQWGTQTILAVMQILDQTLGRLRYSTHRRTLAELALVRIAQLENLDELADLVSRVRSGETPTVVVSRPTRSEGQRALPAAGSSSAAGEKKNATVTHEATISTAVSGAVNSTASLSNENVKAIWQNALAQFTDLIGEMAAMATDVATPAPHRLVVTFPSRYTHCREYCSRPDQQARLERALADLTGGPVRIEFVLSADPPPETAVAPRRAVNPRQRLMEVSQHPLVRKTCELFDAAPVAFDEPSG